MPVVLATELKNQFIKGDAEGYASQNLFFSAHHSLFICHSSQPQEKKKRVFRKQCNKKKKKGRGPGYTDAGAGSGWATRRTTPWSLPLLDVQLLKRPLFNLNGAKMLRQDGKTSQAVALELT